MKKSSIVLIGIIFAASITIGTSRYKNPGIEIIDIPCSAVGLPFAYIGTRTCRYSDTPPFFLMFGGLSTPRVDGISFCDPAPAMSCLPSSISALVGIFLLDVVFWFLLYFGGYVLMSKYRHRKRP